MEQTDEKILGLAYRTVDHSHREVLANYGVKLTSELARTSDMMLTNWGLSKNTIKKLRSVQRKLGFTTQATKQSSEKKVLKILNENSVIDCGIYKDLTVKSLLDAQKTRNLRWLYYNVEYIDFCDDLKKAVKILHTIDKPGSNPEMHELNNIELEANLHGMLKMKIKNQVSKTLRIEKIAERNSHRFDYTKSKMAWANQGHDVIKVSSAGTKPGQRLFEKEIREAGYDIPATPTTPKPTINYEKIYREFLAKVPNNLPEEKRHFLANILYLDYVEDNFSYDRDRYMENVFSDFTYPQYYDTLKKMELEYFDLLRVLSSPQASFKYLMVSDPNTGERYYMQDKAIETKKDSQGMMSVHIFDDDTFLSYPVSEIFDNYKAIVDFPALGETPTIIRIKDIEDYIRKVLTEKKQQKATTQRPKKEGRGRPPQNFDFFVRNDKVLIRIHSNENQFIFTPLSSWVENNLKSAKSLIDSLNYEFKF